MEKLAGGFQSQLSMIFQRPLPSRNLYLCEASTIEDLRLIIKPKSGRFCLLLLMNASSISTNIVLEIAAYLSELGMVYFCAWGPECGLVEDLFDEGAMEVNEGLIGDDVIMTTSHAEESLEETLWYFVHSTFPTAGLTEGCNDWIVASIGNQAWANEIREISHDIIYSPPKD